MPIAGVVFISAEEEGPPREDDVNLDELVRTASRETGYVEEGDR